MSSLPGGHVAAAAIFGTIACLLGLAALLYLFRQGFSLFLIIDILKHHCLFAAVELAALLFRQFFKTFNILVIGLATLLIFSDMLSFFEQPTFLVQLPFF
jgi:hypothetical protein